MEFYIENKDVLIIGNGFDLSCKLPSTYGDFFKKRYSKEFLALFDYDAFLELNIPKIPNVEKMMENYGLIDCLLVANTVKQGINNYNWVDIEAIILSFFQTGTISLQSLVKEYGIVKERSEAPTFFNSIQKRKKLINYLDNKNVFPSELKREAILQLISYKKGVSLRGNNLNKIEESLLQEFKNSLSQLEEDFKKYLQEEVESENSSYLLNTHLLFSALQLNYIKTYLLTFNYTRVDTIPQSTYAKDFYEQNHVHGQIGTRREIIFGIDENSLELDSPYQSFTKTYRKLILDSKRSKTYKKLPRDINNLVFYGHSLGEADFAYFYSLFDFYKIYDSNVNIIFYFNDFIGDGKDLVLNTYASNITNLFNSYSKNSNFTTKNLLHKLNLEGRIRIKEIKISYAEDKIEDIEII